MAGLSLFSFSFFFCFWIVGADKPNLSTKRWNHQANKSLHDCHGPSLYSTNKWKETPSERKLKSKLTFQNWNIKSDFPKLKQKIWLFKTKTENLTFQNWKRTSDFSKLKQKIWLSKIEKENMTFQNWKKNLTFQNWNRKSDFPRLKQEIWLSKTETENLTFQNWKRKSDFPKLKEKNLTFQNWKRKSDFPLCAGMEVSAWRLFMNFQRPRSPSGDPLGENLTFQNWKKKIGLSSMEKENLTLGWDRGVSVAAIYEFPETVVPIWGSSGCSFIPLIFSNHHTLSLSKDSNFPERERGWNDVQHNKVAWFTGFFPLLIINANFAHFTLSHFQTFEID